MLLLIAIVAAIALTLRQRKDSRRLDPSQQVRVKAADRLRMVKMDADVEPKPVAEPAAAKEGT